MVVAPAGRAMSCCCFFLFGGTKANCLLTPYLGVGYITPTKHVTLNFTSLVSLIQVSV